jgi:hypothetical protein
MPTLELTIGRETNPVVKREGRGSEKRGKGKWRKARGSRGKEGG